MRAAFPAQLVGVRAADLIFVDGSGVNLAMTRLHARSLCGTRAFGSAPRNWGDNVSIVSALGLRGPVASMYLPGATDGSVFLTYLKKVLVPKLWKGAVVVMDNLGAHKVKGVQSLLESVGARLVYLPPYSPDLNPIELGLEQVQEPLAPRGRTHPPHLGSRHPHGPSHPHGQRRPRLLQTLRLLQLTITSYALTGSRRSCVYWQAYHCACA